MSTPTLKFKLKAKKTEALSNLKGRKPPLGYPKQKKGEHSAAQGHLESN